MNKKLFQLARMVMKFAEVVTDKGTLIGELEVGTDVQIITEEGNLEAAPDGEYTADDKIYVIAEGKVTEVKETAVEDETIEEVLEEETPVEEAPVEDENLEAKLQEAEAKIAELEAKIAELEAQLAEKPVEEPIELSAVAKQNTEKKNGVLKYFQD